MENIAMIAELLSAFAAFMTVALAVAELTARGKSKKAEVAVEVYSEHLYLVQQIDYAVSNARALTEKCDHLTKSELIAYAQAHMLDKNLLASVQKIEIGGIKNTNLLGKNSKTEFKEQLSVFGDISNLIITINTFYQSISDGLDCSCEQIKRNFQYIDDLYSHLSPIMNSTSNVLKSNLKKTKDSSNRYLILLCACGLLFFALCFILNI